jgi:hypothetical protein
MIRPFVGNSRAGASIPPVFDKVVEEMVDDPIAFAAKFAFSIPVIH